MEVGGGYIEPQKAKSEDFAYKIAVFEHSEHFTCFVSF